MGIAIGTLTFSLAGYMLKGLGVFSRTTITSNIWLSILVCLCVVFSKEMPRKYARLVFIGHLFLIMVFMFASANQICNWARSWERQKKILREMPAADILKMPSGSVVILNEPSKINGIEVFAASWDITNAVYQSIKPVMSPQTRPPEFLPIRDDMNWDGAASLRIGVNQTIMASELWMYTPTSRKLERIIIAGPIK